MKQKLEYIWITPGHKDGKLRKCVSLYRWGEWIEVYANEALMCHPSYEQELSTYFMVKCDEPKVYPAIDEALKARGNLSMVTHTH